jgi:hypothetical protein
MNNDQRVGVMILCLILLFVLLAFGGAWYGASVQSLAYERQGVHLTAWEIMWGAKPVKVVQ